MSVLQRICSWIGILSCNPASHATVVVGRKGKHSIYRTCYIWFGLGCKTVCVLLGVLSTFQLKIIVPLQVRDGLAICAGREEKASQSQRPCPKVKGLPE